MKKGGFLFELLSLVLVCSLGQPFVIDPVLSLGIHASMEQQSKNNLQAHVSAYGNNEENPKLSDTKTTAVEFSLSKTRSLILHLTVLVGHVCSLVLPIAPLDPAPIATYVKNSQTASLGSNNIATAEIKKSLARILSCLLDISASTSINLEIAICNKMELNRRKYPVELCRVCSSSFVTTTILIHPMHSYFSVFCWTGKSRKIYGIQPSNRYNQRHRTVNFSTRYGRG